MSLFFQNPAMLFGLLAAALPLIIHLISRRRARRVHFAALEFVLRSKKKSARHIRLRQLLLLLARTLLFAALAFAMAKPILKPKSESTKSDAPAAVAIVLDASASMQALIDGTPAFRIAKRNARERLLKLPADTKLFGVLCAKSAKDLTQELGFNQASLLDALDQSDVTFEYASMAVCIERATRALSSVSEGRKEVWVFSDLAEHAMKNESNASAKGVWIEWNGTSDDAPNNHALSDLVAERTSAQEGVALKVSTKITRYTGPTQEVSLDLFLTETDDKSEGQRRGPLTRVTSEVGAGASETRTMTQVVGDEQSISALEVVASDDALTFDNRVFAPIDIARPLEVLIVDGAPQSIPFRDEVYYLESALRQYKAAQARLRVNVIGRESFGAAKLKNARVVILANVSRLPDESVGLLEDFVKAGGGLLVSSGDQVDVDWANLKLGNLLPLGLRGTKALSLLDDASVKKVVGLAKFDLSHPLFKNLSSDDDALGLRRVQTHTLMLVEPSAQKQYDVLVRFTNDAPALVSSRVGAGQVMLLTTTIDRDWSDLAIRPGFLPLIQRMILVLAGVPLDESDSRLIIGETLTKDWPNAAVAVQIKSPENDTRVIKRGDEASWSFAEAKVPGIYDVAYQKEGGEFVEADLSRFAAYVDARESNLRKASNDELKEAAPKNAQMRNANTNAEDTPLWPWFFVLALLFFAFEAWLVRRASK